MMRKVAGSSSNVHGHKEVKNSTGNFVCKIFQDVFAEFSSVLFFARNLVRSLCRRVVSCLNGALFSSAKKDKTPQEKTGEKTDRAASQVLGKEKLIKKESDLGRVLDSKEDELESDRERELGIQETLDLTLRKGAKNDQNFP